MLNWQPMESAPRDGTEILAWRKDCGTLLVRYTAPMEFMTDDEIEGLDLESAETHDWFYADFISGGRLDGDETPTLWTPLPEPTP